MSIDEDKSRYIDKLVEQLGIFDVHRIPLRYLLETKVYFQNSIQYLEFVIATVESESLKEKCQLFRLKLRVDCVIINQIVENCRTPELLDENTDDEVDR